MPIKPDWTVSALNPQTEARGQVGLGWNNDDGTIQIVLNNFAVLDGSKGLKIRLFPYKERTEPVWEKPTKAKTPTKSGGPFGEVIPF